MPGRQHTAVVAGTILDKYDENRPLRCDDEGVLIIIDSRVHLVHEGRAFSVNRLGTLASAAALIFVGRVGATPVHFDKFELSVSDGPVHVEFIEAPTVSVLGTQVFPLNRNRIIGATSEMLTYLGSTITGGTVLEEHRVYSSGAGSNSESGVALLEDEWVLEPGTDYAIRITNETSPGSTIGISAEFNFYEAVI